MIPAMLIGITHERIVVIGGSGFLGRHLVPRLSAQIRRVVVPTRRYMRARHLILLPTVDVVELDVHDGAALQRLVAANDAVINLAGVLHGRPPDRRAPDWGPDFDDAHVDIVRKLVDACRASGKRRLIHVSALGVTDDGERSAPSRYLRSKAAAERIVRESELDWTILRPSVMFGPEDRFLNLFAKLQRFSPVMLLPMADAKFQPIYVADVAQAIVNVLDLPQSHGRCFELAGPEVLTLRELVELAGRASGHRRRILVPPEWLARLQAWLLEHLPGRTLMSRDNLESMKVPNVAHGPLDPLLGIRPAAVTAIAPTYLGRPSSRFMTARERARR